MPTAAWWKRFYARERASLDLDALLDRAPAIDFPEGGALVFPHTRLARSGALVAAVAAACARRRRDVLAIGVLHGARERDAAAVARARAGDPDAVRALRGVHDEDGLAAEEFSLDGFSALFARACEREGAPAPRVVRRYPLLAGAEPRDLPGLDELRALAGAGLTVVATTDPIHHGVGYDTPPAELRAEGAEALAFARARIGEQLAALERADFGEFARLAARDRSDFRDAGPALALVRPAARWSLDALLLVDYADVFSCARPTWVAAARVALRPA